MFNAYRLVPVLFFADTSSILGLRPTNRLPSAFDLSGQFGGGSSTTADANFMLGGAARSPWDLSFASFLDPSQSIFNPGGLPTQGQGAFPMAGVPVFLLDPRMLTMQPVPILPQLPAPQVPIAPVTPPAATPPAAGAPPATPPATTPPAAGAPPATPPATTPPAAGAPPATPPATTPPAAGAPPATPPAAPASVGSQPLSQNSVMQLIDAHVAANRAASTPSSLSTQIIETMRNSSAPLGQNLNSISGAIHGDGFNSLQNVSNIARDLDTSLVNSIKQDLSTVGLDFQSALGRATSQTVSDVNEQLGNARKIFNETTAAIKKP
jgi:hypothetical protein